MKRRPKKLENKKYVIEGFYSFFNWKNCFYCELDFRRENGKRIEIEIDDRRFPCSISEKLYLCEDCGTKEYKKVETLIDNHIVNKMGYQPQPTCGD